MQCNAGPPGGIKESKPDQEALAESRYGEPDSPQIHGRPAFRVAPPCVEKPKNNKVRFLILYASKKFCQWVLARVPGSMSG
jgi:hypothetical protein